MATYAIGDIQGCYKSLQKLLKSAHFDQERDRLWCVGDLVNRGPASLETLRFLHDLGEQAVIVLGNHDLHFLAIHYDCAPARSKDTLGDLLQAPDCETLANWLRSKPLAYCETVNTTAGEKRFLMVHAGVAPRWSLKKTLRLSAEVEAALQGPDFRDFLREMYGDVPSRWSKKLTGQERLRTITNYFTRMRFCDKRGTLDLRSKEGIDTAPKGFRPWFEFEKLTPETTILFGHWAALEGKTGNPQVHALDTGCVWGRQLSMLRLEDSELFSV